MGGGAQYLRSHYPPLEISPHLNERKGERRCEKKRKEVGGSIQRGGERHIREENIRDRKDDVEHRFAAISHKIQTLIDQYLGGTFDRKSVLH